jgi:hypothetical protein
MIVCRDRWQHFWQRFVAQKNVSLGESNGRFAVAACWQERSGPRLGDD